MGKLVNLSTTFTLSSNAVMVNCVYIGTDYTENMQDWSSENFPLVLTTIKDQIGFLVGLCTLVASSAVTSLQRLRCKVVH